MQGTEGTPRIIPTTRVEIFSITTTGLIGRQ
jgi:hypothetical protein